MSNEELAGLQGCLRLNKDGLVELTEYGRRVYLAERSRRRVRTISIISVVASGAAILLTALALVLRLLLQI